MYALNDRARICRAELSGPSAPADQKGVYSRAAVPVYLLASAAYDTPIVSLLPS